MTTADTDDVIASFVRGAKDASDAGFDGVEVHGGHRYLIDAFLWAGTNFREDEYGGGPRARVWQPKSSPRSAT